MALLTIDRNPSARQLRSFGVLLALFVPLFGAMVAWRTGRVESAYPIWIGGAALTVVYWLVTPLRRLVYVGWMYAAFPIGWTVSHILMAVIYYGVLTPIGFIIRTTGRDPLL